MKTCCGCKATKPLSEFHKNAGRKDGLNSTCKECTCEYTRGHYLRNKGKHAAMGRSWRKRNRFKHVLVQSRGTAKLEGGYVPCLATAEWIESKFDGKCQICGVPEVECTHQLAMDHDHETGLFRGWLCANCNKALGLLKDSREVVLNAVIYLQRNEKVT